MDSASFTGGGPIIGPSTCGAFYESHQWAKSGNLEFKIPMAGSEFDIGLMFAETRADSGPGVRQMVVKINGKAVPQAGPKGLLAVFSRAGGFNKPVYLHLAKVPMFSGVLNVTLEHVPGKSNPTISGIVVMGELADVLVGDEGLEKKPPIGGGPASGECLLARTVTGRMGLDGFAMNIGGWAVPNISWGADNMNYIVEASNGIQAVVPAPVPVNGSRAPLYLTHRWTKAKSLTYKLPVPAGTYKVALLHVESFVSGIGKRTFGISINGDVKAEAYDVFAQVGQNKPLLKQY